jgi:hypothetical protein
MDEYLKIPEPAALLRISPRTLRNKMSAGVFRLGVHYFSPPGLGPRFKRRAIVSWIEQSEQEAANESMGESDSIPMARGYELGKPILRRVD